jgi:hypothetical protein
MDLRQMDVMGRVYLAGGTEVKIVTGIEMTTPSSWSAPLRSCGLRTGRCAGQVNARRLELLLRRMPTGCW